MITEQTFTEVAYVRHWEQNTIHLARGERRWGRGCDVDGGGACHAIACRQALSCTKDRVITPVRVGVLRSLCPQIDADCHCNPMCVFGWFVSLGAREVTLPPDACIRVGLSLGPPDACILGRFVAGRCVVGRTRSDPALPPPLLPQPARCVCFGWLCPRSGIDPHYLWRKTITTDRRQVV